MTVSSAKNAYPTEAALCEAFIGAARALGGWTVYPETAGFDMLLVWDATGAQLGVEAKLKLNAKVAEQILPAGYGGSMDTGPDFRAVLVPEITESNAGIARMLEILGVLVFRAHHGRNGHTDPAIGLGSGRRSDIRAAPWDSSVKSWLTSGDAAWHDWNPINRCTLPSIVPDVAAGVPAPRTLSPWKIGALKVLAALELDGFVTAKSVRAQGVDPRRFCASDGWLEPLGQGRWGRGTVPAFDQQHPEPYAQILAEIRALRQDQQP